MIFKQNPLVRQWAQLNAPFASHSNRGPKEGPRWIVDWRGPLAVSVAFVRAAQSADKLKERLITGLVAALRDEQRRIAATAVDAHSLVA